MVYDEFVESCLDELEEKQGELTQKYNLDSYPNWFYDQPSGILTFSGEERELNFRYYEVGTYEKSAETWKWSWDNDHTLMKVKRELDVVRQYGMERGYEKLAQGLLESDAQQGWGFTAIAARLLNGIGAYRPETDRLLIFMVLHEIIENEIAKEEKEKFVDCGNHERRRRAFVCRHLDRASNKGFEEAFETYPDMEFEYDDDDFQAWCDECEKMREESDGWDETAMKFAEFRVICEACYFELKESNK